MNRDLPGADAAAAAREDFVLRGEAPRAENPDPVGSQRIRRTRQRDGSPMSRDLPGASAGAAARENFVLHGEAVATARDALTGPVRNGFGEPAKMTETP